MKPAMSMFATGADYQRALREWYETRISELEKDAARYRFILTKEYSVYCSKIREQGIEPYTFEKYAETSRAMVDSERASQGENSHG